MTYFNRRHLLSTLLLAPCTPLMQAQGLKSRRPLAFPRDHGAHPDFRTEWWYLTGWLSQPQARDPIGFQVTFFRSRVDGNAANPSSFAAQQLLFAHAAVSAKPLGKILHDQRIVRAGAGPNVALASATQATTQINIRDWQLAKSGGGYRARVASREFEIDLELEVTQPLLLQGQQGLSSKGPKPEQTSYYYSQPQLKASGKLLLQGKSQQIAGVAWLDHEWSESLLDPDAVGWDWIGMNLADGSALTAFRLRRADGSALWAGGSHRSAQDTLRVFEASEVRFEPLRIWQSPATQGRYPVAVRVITPVGTFTTQPLLDNQELDSRASTGTVYWEGLSELLNEAGQPVGRGYLELTGYVGRLRL